MDNWLLPPFSREHIYGAILRVYATVVFANGAAIIGIDVSCALALNGVLKKFELVIIAAGRECMVLGLSLAVIGSGALLVHRLRRTPASRLLVVCTIAAWALLLLGIALAPSFAVA